VSLLGGALLELFTHAGKLGMSHASDYLRRRRGNRPAAYTLDAALDGMPSLPRLERLPSMEEALGGRLPALPPMPRNDNDLISPPPAPTPTDTPADAPDVGGSYADEMEDPSIACVPCTRSHLATMAGAAEEAARSGDPSAWRKNAAVVAGEALVMEEYDWRPDKMARARPDDRAAIEAVQPQVREMVSGIPQAPRKLVLAWAAVGEALRFAARPRPKPTDRQQVDMRMQDAERWLNYCERVELPRVRGGVQVAPLLGEARHELARKGYTPEAISFAYDRLGRAVEALTPAPSREQVDAMHRQAKEAMRGFYTRVLGNLRARHGGASGRQDDSPAMSPADSPAMSPADSSPMSDEHYDRDAKIPGRLVRAYLGDELVPFDGLLGATPETAADFQRNLELLRDMAIPVRERDLGEIGGGPIKGAFSPATETIVLAPAVTSEDPDALYTLAHETVHSLLHNRRCDVYGGVQKGRAQAELEADLATLMLFVALGLPVETEEGQRVSTANVQTSIRSLEREAPAGAIERARWAAGVLEQAMRGDPTGAAARARDCPKPAGMQIPPPKPPKTKAAKKGSAA
jgi:hypothetical protein